MKFSMMFGRELEFFLYHQLQPVLSSKTRARLCSNCNNPFYLKKDVSFIRLIDPSRGSSGFYDAIEVVKCPHCKHRYTRQLAELEIERKLPLPKS